MYAARTFAVKHGLRSLRVDELIVDRAVDLVLNLTPPRAHAAVVAASLEAGRNVMVYRDDRPNVEVGVEIAGAFESDGRVVASYETAGHVRNLAFDDGGSLWVAADHGLSRIKDGRIATLTMSNGLPCEGIDDVLGAVLIRVAGRVHARRV